MDNRRMALTLGVLVGSGALAYALWPKERSSSASPPARSAGALVPDHDEHPGRASNDAAPIAAPKSNVAKPTRDTTKAAERELRRRRLQEKYGRRPPTNADGPAARDASDRSDGREQPELPPASWSSLPEDYIGGILRDQLVPVARACYEDIAPEGTAGSMMLSVAVIGDEELGGVVDRVDVKHDQSTLQGELSECVRQAVYDMEFAPPEQGQGVQEFDFELRVGDD